MAEDLRAGLLSPGHASELVDLLEREVARPGAAAILGAASDTNEDVPGVPEPPD